MANTDYDDDAGLTEDAREFAASMGVILEEPAAGTEEAAAAEKPKEAPAAAAEAESTEEAPAAASGKILGKFESVDELAKSYKELESTLGKKGATEGAMRAELAKTGYTFDEAGKPVAPAPAAAEPVRTDPAPKTETAPTADRSTWAVEPETGYKIDPKTGYKYDHLGVPVISDETWNEFYAEDPAAAARYHNQWMRQKADAEQLFEQTQQSAVSQKRTSIKATVATQVSPEFADELDAALEANLFKNPGVRADLKTNPVFVELLSRAFAGQMLLEKHGGIVNTAANQAADAAGKNRRIVAPAVSSSVSAPARPAAAAESEASGKLTDDERSMARSFGLTDEQYLEGKA